LISSYVDNGLSREAEQDFLIKLAANDNLRNSFRTEMVLKEVVRRDESLITPPRALRASVFAAVGLAASEASASQPEAAVAASQSPSFFKTLFATKFNTAMTTIGLSVATLAGYVGHGMMNKPAAAPIEAVQPATIQQESAPAFAEPKATEVVKANEEKQVVQERVAQKAVKSTTSSAPAIKTAEPLPNSIPSDAGTPQTDVVNPTTTDINGVGEGSMTPNVKKSSDPK
jgi:hypothetical protein